MHISDLLLRFVILAPLVGIFSAGITDGYKRNRIFPSEWKSTWAIRGIHAGCCIIFQLIVIIAHKEAGNLVEALELLLAYLPTNYGVGTVIYTHLFKPLHEKP